MGKTVKLSEFLARSESEIEVSWEMDSIPIQPKAGATLNFWAGTVHTGQHRALGTHRTVPAEAAGKDR